MAARFALTTGVVYVRSWLGTLSGTNSGIGATSTDGLVLQNTTDAAAGVQQWSPRLRFHGEGWKTDATAASQNVDIIQELVPVQGTAAPSGQFLLRGSINDATYVDVARIKFTTNPLSRFSLFQDFSSSSQFEEGYIGWDGDINNHFTLGTTHTGANNRNIAIDAAGGAVVWSNNVTDVRPNNDNVTTLGNASKRYSDVFAAGRYYIGGSGIATSSARFAKKITGIADAAATDILTVTIPNANHAAAIKLTFLSSNGSTDAFESSRVATGHVVVARTAGVVTAAVAATIDDAAIATVAAGATHTLAYNVSAISGAAGATNTFTIQVTINDSGNVGSNQLVVLAEIVNAEATGITIA